MRESTPYSHVDTFMMWLYSLSSAGENVQGYKLDCSATAKTSTCTIAATLTKGSLLAGDITDFLVKGAYMFATRDNQVCYWIIKLFIAMIKVRVMGKIRGEIFLKKIFSHEDMDHVIISRQKFVFKMATFVQERRTNFSLCSMKKHVFVDKMEILQETSFRKNISRKIIFRKNILLCIFRYLT